MAVNNSSESHASQYGGALLISMLILVILSSVFLFSMLSGSNAKVQREKKTLVALYEAKNALLAYTTSVNLIHPACAGNCRRPGDLPCPDTNNDGVAEVACGNAAGTTGQALRIGRLPWKTLGLDDVRDGNGDRLWYAVSNRFKQNTRAFPLNSDTVGTISVRDTNGNLLHDATGASGVAAIVMSAGISITRQDAVVQSRILANENNPIHYLDNAFGEDNANFADGGANGFIKGVINDATGNTLLNDQLIALSQAEVMKAIEPRVAKEVINAVSAYFGSNSFYPSPASFSDTICLGVATIATGFCVPDAMISGGRVPVNPLPDWSATSILIGTANNNWFQQNGWREHVYYSHGALTLMPENISKSLVVIATGPTIGLQIRATNTDKTSEANYLELDNISPLDDTYLHLPIIQHGGTFNDFLVGQP